jgi:phosphoribosylanthranilate isomerase
MVKVKICGVADVASALLSAELGADYLGLNFWPGSPRFVDLPKARQIAAAVRAAAPGVALVGVFVNPTAAEVEKAAAAADLDLLQFSGDEAPAAVRPFAARAIKALRTHDAEAVAAFAGCWAVLLDTPRSVGGPAYGGTGLAWEYGAAAGVVGAMGAMDGSGAAGVPRVFLAGGLGPGNARRVVATLRPFAIDVCSRVESAPGKKDPRLLRQLFEEVRNGQATPAA